MFSMDLIAQPQPMLSGFVRQLNQPVVNNIDSQVLHPTQKIAALVGDDTAFQHLYLSFAFVLAPNTLLEIQCFGLDFRITGELDGPLVKGIISASFATWKKFLPLATHKDCSEWLIRVVNEAYMKGFKLFPYFQDMKSTPQFGNTFALVKA